MEGSSGRAGGNIRRDAWRDANTEGSAPTEAASAVDPRRERFRAAREAYSHLRTPSGPNFRERLANQWAGFDKFLQNTATSVIETISKHKPNVADLGHIKDRAKDKISQTKVFGRNAGDFVSYIGSHKTELVAGGLAAGIAKAAMRTALVGSGGIAGAAAIGAVGGMASGAVKEYIRQSKEISITEDNRLIIGFLKNEYHKLPSLQKGQIAKAGMKGAVAGAIGGIIGFEIADFLTEHAFAQTIDTTHPATAPTSAPTAEATPSPTPSPTATPELTPTPKPPAVDLTPTPPAIGSETLTIPQGSSIWNETRSYLQQNLGHPPTNTELNEAVNKIMSENHITDAKTIPAGANLNIHGVNEMIGKVSPPHLDISPELAKMPEVVQLPAGSNPWEEVSKYGSSYLGRPLTSAENLLVTQELARQSGIAVPSWGLVGEDHTKLKAGFKLIFNDPVKKLLAGMKK